MNKSIIKNATYISAAIAAAISPNNAYAQQTKPNIVLIMCDDMGFSDLGCYGSEINTPNINSLASVGTRFSQFKNTGRSCPSRAALLTGMHQHSVDMGWMTAVDEHREGYRGEISFNVPTIADWFRSAGYHTAMSGKWHVTLDDAFGTPNGSYPTQRGFERYYGCLSGGGSYYKPTPVYNNLTPITEFSDDYYYTNAITDSACSFIKAAQVDLRPMFLYVAHYAPHLPLQAPDSVVNKCIERYKVGYDKLRLARFNKQKELGLVYKNTSLPIFNEEFGNNGRPQWESLSDNQRKQWIKDMATYAAMIEIMDQGIGKLINALKETNRLENTIFIFLSDNGATNEGGYINQLMADLSNTPYRNYKQWTHNGGISSPLIIAHGKDLASCNTSKATLISTPCHITDILPTCLQFAGIDASKSPIGFSQLPTLAGVSLVPALNSESLPERDLFFEHQSSSAIISSHWKLVRRNDASQWQLVDLNTDPFETQNLADKHPDIVKQLEAKWMSWAKSHKVLPLEKLPWSQRIKHYRTLFE